MVEFFSGMNVLDILLCCVAMAAFCVAVTCIIQLYFLSKGDKYGKKSEKSESKEQPAPEKVSGQRRRYASDSR